MQHILLITTGGTIASSVKDNGLSVSENSHSILKYINKIASEYDITTLDLFQLDSSNIQPEEWQTIAHTIYMEYRKYDGIILTHGTDTMGYTASALSYMLLNVPIPIVLTGSQLPIAHPLTDAIENLRCAFAMASSGIPGVFVAFNRKVILGTRSVKVKTTSFDAFESVNQEYIATIDGKGLNLNHALIEKLHLLDKKEFILRPDLNTNVILIKLTPGFNPAIFDMIIKMNYKGVVIEAFGAGGIQFIRRDLTHQISNLVRNGISVVACSQCLYERSDFSIYEVGQKAIDSGIIEGYDMTSEACITKLMWLLAYYKDPNIIKEKFKTSYFGELNI